MTTYIRATDSEAVEMDESWIIMHPDQFTVTKINEVGGVCWSLLKEPQTIDSLAAHLSEQYEIAPQEAQQDIEQFLAQMQQLGMVRHGA